MFSLYGDLSAEKRMSRFGRDRRCGGPNSGSRSFRSATIGALPSSSHCRRCPSNHCLLLFARRPRKKPRKSPFQPLNSPATVASLNQLVETRLVPPHTYKEEPHRHRNVNFRPPVSTGATTLHL